MEKGFSLAKYCECLYNIYFSLKNMLSVSTFLEYKFSLACNYTVYSHLKKKSKIFSKHLWSF